MNELVWTVGSVVVTMAVQVVLIAYYTSEPLKHRHYTGVGLVCVFSSCLVALVGALYHQAIALRWTNLELHEIDGAWLVRPRVPLTPAQQPTSLLTM